MLDSLLAEETEFNFKHFDNSKALALGLEINHLTKVNPYSNVYIEIIINDQIIFAYATDNSISIDNELWCRKKSNVTKRFKHSSLYIKKYYLENKQTTFEDYLQLDLENYRAKGGSFPLIVNSLVVGSVTVSGMKEELDHQIVLEALRKIKEEDR